MAEPVFVEAPAAVIGHDFVSPHTVELLVKKKRGGTLDVIDDEVDKITAPFLRLSQSLKMAASTLAGAPLVVIGQDFVSPHTVELLVKKKGVGELVVMDCNDNVKFQVTDHFFSRRLDLVDANGKKIITLKPKTFSMHEKWEVYRGESESLLFTVKRSKTFQRTTKLHVILCGNEDTDGTHDYRLEENSSEESCIIYVGESNNMVAEMHKKKSKKWFRGHNDFILTVNPNMDSAFIVSIIGVLHAINTGSASSTGALDVVAAVVNFGI